MNMRNIDIKKMVISMEKISKEAINNMEEELNKTRNELEQKSSEKIKNLESKMIAKDTEIMNEVKKDQPLLSTEEPIPEMCKYIHYKNLTDKTRRHEFFNSSGISCDKETNPESGCKKSSDWRGRGLFFFLHFIGSGKVYNFNEILY